MIQEWNLEIGHSSTRKIVKEINILMWFIGQKNVIALPVNY